MAIHPFFPLSLANVTDFASATLSLKRYVSPHLITLCGAEGRRQQELRKQFESISDLRAEIKSLQADNLKLYEKVRYMQSYRTDASSAGPSSTGGGAGILNGVMRNREDEIGRYKDKYEESMNPFEAFKGRVNPSSGGMSRD